MDIENLKARYYMLLGQAEEAKNIYTRAVQEVNDLAKQKQEEEAKQNVDTEKQPEPATTPEPEATNK